LYSLAYIHPRAICARRQAIGKNNVETLGIIGSGNIGSAIAFLAVGAGIPVVVSNSRGPASLADLTAKLGPLATAGTVDQAAAGDIVILAVPLTACTAISPEALRGKPLLDTSNYYPFRDSRIAQLDRDEVTTSEMVQQHFRGIPLVTAFNNMLAHHIPQLTRPTGAPDRSAVPIASDSVDAKRAAAALIDQLGFDVVDAGGLADTWRFEPEAAAYTRIYLADPETPLEQLLEAPAAPLSADGVRAALDRAVRVRVAGRQF
jgi:predicted dinucleotide-binding enzyme